MMIVEPENVTHDRYIRRLLTFVVLPKFLHLRFADEPLDLGLSTDNSLSSLVVLCSQLTTNTVFDDR